jgi:hypothetical protein
MSKPLHIQLLEQFEAVGKPLDISPFMTKNFCVSTAIYDENKAINFGPPLLFLQDLEDRCVICAENEEDGLWAYFEEGEQTAPYWRCIGTDDKLYYYITSIGLDYLDQYEINQLSKRANNHIIKNFYIAIISAVVIIAISVFGLLTSIKSLDLSTHTAKADSISSVKVDRRLDTLSRLLLKVQESLPRPKKTSTSH